MSSSDREDSPRKRLKTSSPHRENSNHANHLSHGSPRTSISGRARGSFPPPSNEAEVGITEYISLQTPGFRGTFKKRYTDFLVNEILPNGDVLHLQNLQVPAAAPSKGKSGHVESHDVAAKDAQQPPVQALTTAQTSKGAQDEIEQDDHAKDGPSKNLDSSVSALACNVATTLTPHLGV
jgi:tRNA pseudouridine13 synthase